MLATVKTFCFVGKVELSKIPLFGFFYKRTCILVDRGCSKSRLKVLMSQKRLDRGLSVCIFLKVVFQMMSPSLDTCFPTRY
jgi:1-acyl-sn-glycerol-3-phosphate acyltransferase